ncbi:hypothetical protein HMPREF0262_03013 [Clostridium sp. ATCC 29733]|nr:hypothetical protein HMPREF0262_03013 [Clostridium sp. ATCC 29733]
MRKTAGRGGRPLPFLCPAGGLLRGKMQRSADGHPRRRRGKWFDGAGNRSWAANGGTAVRGEGQIGKAPPAFALAKGEKSW